MSSQGWQTQLSKYAAKAGFEAATAKALRGAPKLPSTAAFWRASYAQLLVLPIDSTQEAALRDSARLGQEWLDLSCIEQERADNRVMDAYLLLVLGDPLPRDLLRVVQEIELNPTACRKHVVWPCSGDDEEVVWRRLLRVTVLGLPVSPTAAGMTNTPRLHSDFERAILSDVKHSKGRGAARLHAERNDAGSDV